MRKTVSASILAVAAVLLAAGARAQDPVHVAATPFLVKGGEGLQTDPHISGSLMAFTDLDPSLNGYRVYYVDLSVAGAVPQPVPVAGEASDHLPEVDGSHIVFLYADGVTEGIRAFDANNPSAGVVELSPAPGVRRSSPAVGGDTVAFTEAPAGSALTEICVSSLQAPLEPATCLTADGLYDMDPAVSPDGNAVVWHKCSSGNLGPCIIYAAERDPASGVWGPERLLADTAGNDRWASTDGRLVAWTSSGADANGAPATHVYYASLDGTRPPQQINPADLSGAREMNAHVSGGLISFDRYPADTSVPDVYVHDPATGTNYAVAETAEYEVLGALSHDRATGDVRVVWAQRSITTGDMDVWATRFDIARPRYGIQALFDQSRSYRQGAVVPIRLQLLDANGVNVSSPALVVTASGLVQKDSTASTLMAEDAGNANPDSAFRYDASLQGYVFNLSTKNLSAGTWDLRFAVSGDNRQYGVAFDLR